MRHWPFATVLAAALLAGPARANVVGGDLQNFNAVPGGIDYVTVEASETLEPGFVNLSLMLNHAVNSLPYYEDANQNRIRYNDALTMVDYGVAYGLADALEVGAAVQDLIQQSVSQNADHGQFDGTGITNYRGYGKLNLVKANPIGLATVLTGVFNNVRDNPLVGQGGSPVGIFEVAVDGKLAGLAIAGNVGYRFRKKGEPLGSHLQPMGNQYIGSAGMSYFMPSFDTKLIMEVVGSRPAEATNTSIEQRQSSSAELTAGIKFDATSAIAVHAGGGTELIRGAATPDWRLYAGLDWSIGPLVRLGAHSRQPPVLQKTGEGDEERAVLHNIHFATGSDQIPPDAEAELKELAVQLQQAPYDHIVVEGHTDSVGSFAFNQHLSERRASTIRQWLIDHAHVDPLRIEAKGYGPAHPIADNGNFQGRQRNRRVEVLVKRHGQVLEKTSEKPHPPGEEPAAPPPDAP